LEKQRPSSNIISTTKIMAIFAKPYSSMQEKEMEKSYIDLHPYFLPLKRYSTKHWRGNHIHPTMPLQVRVLPFI